MNVNELRAHAQTPLPLIKFAGALWLVAAAMVMIAAVSWVVLAVMAGDYFTNTKAARDAAIAGSGILSQQGSIEAVKDWVLPLAFLGLATYLLGFGLASGDILRNVRLRGAARDQEGLGVLRGVQGRIAGARSLDSKGAQKSGNDSKFEQRGTVSF